MTEEKQAFGPWYWPKIEDETSAIRASDTGMWGALIVAVVTALIATVAMTAGRGILGIDPWAYVDAALFAVVAWRIRARSRPWAVAGLALYVIEKAMQLADGTTPGGASVMGILFLLFFISGVRGTFAYHRLRTVPVTA